MHTLKFIFLRFFSPTELGRLLGDLNDDLPSEMGGGGGGIGFNSQLASSSASNSAINMHSSSPQMGSTNKQIFPGLAGAPTGGSVLPQPVGISTSALPTPTLPAISSTPAHPNNIGHAPAPGPANALQASSCAARMMSTSGSLTNTSASTLSPGVGAGGVRATPGVAMNSLYNPGGGGGHHMGHYGQPMLDGMPPRHGMPWGSVMHPGMHVSQQGMLPGTPHLGMPSHSTMVHYHPGMGMRSPYHPGMGMMPNHHPAMGAPAPGHHLSRMGMAAHQPGMTTGAQMRVPMDRMSGQPMYGHTLHQPGSVGASMAGRMVVNQQPMIHGGQQMMQTHMSIPGQQQIHNQPVRLPGFTTGGSSPFHQDNLLSSLEPSLRPPSSYGLGQSQAQHPGMSLASQAQPQPSTSQHNDFGAAFGSPAPPPQTSSICNPSSAAAPPPSSQLSGNTQVSSLPQQQQPLQAQSSQGQQQLPQGMGVGSSPSLPRVVSLIACVSIHFACTFCVRGACVCCTCVCVHSGEMSCTKGFDSGDGLCVLFSGIQ